MTLLVALHALAAVFWVGGMFFALLALRPALRDMAAPAQQALWVAVFGRFFPWVLAAVAVLFATGYGMVFGVYGGFRNLGIHVHLMNGLGLLMMLAFLHVYFAPYRRLRQAVAAGDAAAGARSLGQIRMIMTLNLVLGVIVVIAATGGRYAS